MSSVVARYMMEKSPDRAVTTMTIDDADHYTPEQRQKIIDSYPPHEREARTKGVPSMGSGRIFPVTEESIAIDPIPIDNSWVQIGGMDFGYDHPFGAVCVAWDRDADVVYITKEYREREATPIIHSAAVRPWGTWLPWAWPHDGLQHDKGSGVQLMQQYKDQGLNMLHDRATFLDGTNGVEAGVSDMLQRMQTGRFKVFKTCRSWLEEFRLYHRENGKIVKERDDLISASRYAIMMLRRAEVGAKTIQEYRPYVPIPNSQGWMAG
jgi:Terminase RNaseH-like domain/Terminase large subunit, T4likevirus-type, N-terminal